MDTDLSSLWTVLLWSFIWISAIVVWFHCLVDLFRDSTLGGWGKAGWTLVLVFIPWLGALIYIIARGRAMSTRQAAAMAQQAAVQERYITEVAGGTTSASADQTAGAKALLDSGAIDQAEFQALKAKALA